MVKMPSFICSAYQQAYEDNAMKCLVQSVVVRENENIASNYVGFEVIAAVVMKTYISPEI
jgi:hypothetical protein